MHMDADEEDQQQQQQQQASQPPPDQPASEQAFNLGTQEQTADEQDGTSTINDGNRLSEAATAVEQDV